ncbi:MAG TPA: hypothetical protein VMG99_09005 [Thermoplasmata archaeon]|nr:hypothetical protein [Thermoplasmata archaeon]
MTVELDPPFIDWQRNEKELRQRIRALEAREKALVEALRDYHLWISEWFPVRNLLGLEHREMFERAEALLNEPKEEREG